MHGGTWRPNSDRAPCALPASSPPFSVKWFFSRFRPPSLPPPPSTPPCSQWVSLSSMLLQKAEYGGEGSPEYQQLVELDEKHVCLTQVWRQHVWNPV